MPEPMPAILVAFSKVRDGMWVKGAPTHVFAELLTQLEKDGWVLQQRVELQRIALSVTDESPVEIVRRLVGEVNRFSEEARRAEKRLESTQGWYAVRIHRIKDAAKKAGIWDEVACILANGTAEATEPPSYAQLLNLANQRAELVEAELEVVKEDLAQVTTEREKLREEQRSEVVHWFAQKEIPDGMGE